jgi:predicted phosphodiesterase
MIEEANAASSPSLDTPISPRGRSQSRVGMAIVAVLALALSVINTGCATRDEERTYRFVVAGHLFSVFLMPIFHAEDFDGESFETVEWLSRATDKRGPDQLVRRDVMILAEDRFQTLVDRFNELEVDGVFMLGDTALDHSEREWELIQKYRNKSNAPWYFVPGNHDMLRETGYPHYMENVGYLNKNIMIGNSQFLLLRPTTWKHGETNLDQVGIDQIKSGLETPAEHRFIMMHHRLFERGNSNWHETVAPLIRGKIHHVFYGNHTGEIMRVWYDLKNQIQHISTAFWNDQEGRGPVSKRLLRDNFILLNVKGDDVWYEPISADGHPWK